MSGMSSELALLSRVRQKFEALEGTCMSRYTSREQKVLATLSYCLSTLEQLHAWAIFAIFPLDEQNSDKYLNFVEQRFQCVVGPLRIFCQVAESEAKRSGVSSCPPKGYLESVITATGSTPRDHSLSPRSSPRGNKGSRDPRGYTLEAGQNSGEGSSGGNLRERVKCLSQKYLDEGKAVNELVSIRIEKCRKDIRTIYRWGQASLLDLHDVMDDSLADELYFMVRGKMARVLSTISVFEEAAEAVERSLSSFFPNESESKEDKQAQRNKDYSQELPVRDTSQSMDLSEMRLMLDRLEDSGFSGSGFSARGVGQLATDLAGPNDSSDSTPGSTTPEPPNSPRPKGLVNHPKIMKDRLQSYALPSKFPHNRMAPLSGTW